MVRPVAVAKKISGRISALGQVDAQLVALAGGLGGDEDERAVDLAAVDRDDAHPAVAEVGVEAGPVTVQLLLFGGLVGRPMYLADDEAPAGPRTR